MHGHDAGNRDALLLSARKVIRRFQAVGGHADCRECGIDPLPDVLGRHAEVLGTKAHIVLDQVCDNLIIGILEHHADLAAYVEELCIVRGIHTGNKHGAAARQ